MNTFLRRCVIDSGQSAAARGRYCETWPIKFRRNWVEAMIVENQGSVFAFLSRPESYGLSDAVEIMETHISMIFLAGPRVFKLKRAVRLPYVDFSTPALRLKACAEEVARNGKAAPGLYLGVRRITRGADGTLVFDGQGEVIDAVVEMVRFDQQCLLDRMALAGGLTPQLMEDTARMIADFHASAPVARGAGGAANIANVLSINEAGFAESHLFQPEELSEFHAVFRSALRRHAALLDQRAKNGKVRLCHGDLHLRNICLFEGRPRLFDCIEFNDAIATIDVLYDLSFLLMDLWHRSLPVSANLVMNNYLDQSEEEDGFALLPFFMALRAAVRAHVTATQIEESSGKSAELGASARSYFNLARTLLTPCGPRLVALGGFSGSGKTTIAEAAAAYIGAPPGARIIESDRVRKAMFGVPADTRLSASAYQPEVSVQVYRQMLERSRRILCAGGSVVAAAVFDRPDSRREIENRTLAVPADFAGIWLDADRGLLTRRIGSRKNGPSDATIEVLEKQLQRGAGEIGWSKVNARGSVAATADAVLAAGGQPPVSIAEQF
jgi:uncharacterized protein